MWPFKRKLEPEPVSDPKPEPEPEPLWLEHKDKWEFWHLCHCGNPSNIAWPVCPQCGCRNSWKDTVGRWEWEYARICSAYGPHTIERNRRFVVWTPEHCTERPNE